VPGPASAFKDQLRAWRNSDGGWGYATGKRSRLEPTCLALLALGEELPGESARLLASWPRRDGLWVDGLDLPPNYGFNGAALVAASAALRSHVPLVEPVLQQLVAGKGLAFEPSEEIRQDSRIQAWPWVDGTFSWVEPTAWCLLAVKKWRRAGDGLANTRVEEAERLLADRTCIGGGRNYGNAVVLAKALPAYVPTTALALLALQDRQELAEVQRSSDFLGREAASEASALSLGLATIALHVFGRPVTTTTAALTSRLDTAAAVGQVVGVAIGLYALDYERHGCAAFRL
jgi:hypothetical protein